MSRVDLSKNLQDLETASLPFACKQVCCTFQSRGEVNPFSLPLRRWQLLAGFCQCPPPHSCHGCLPLWGWGWGVQGHGNLPDHLERHQQLICEQSDASTAKGKKKYQNKRSFKRQLIFDILPVWWKTSPSSSWPVSRSTLMRFPSLYPPCSALWAPSQGDLYKVFSHIWSSILTKADIDV